MTLIGFRSLLWKLEMIWYKYVEKLLTGTKWSEIGG